MINKGIFNKTLRVVTRSCETIPKQELNEISNILMLLKCGVNLQHYKLNLCNVRGYMCRYHAIKLAKICNAKLTVSVVCCKHSLLLLLYIVLNIPHIASHIINGTYLEKDIG